MGRSNMGYNTEALPNVSLVGGRDAQWHQNTFTFRNAKNTHKQHTQTRTLARLTEAILATAVRILL